MVVGVGLDLVEIGRIRKLYEKAGDRFLRRVFTPLERDCLKLKKNPFPSMAARFAAKEAAFKALNLRDAGVSWLDLEVITKPGGKPTMRLRGPAALRAKKMGVCSMHLSLTHSREMAAACLVVEK